MRTNLSHQAQRSVCLHCHSQALLTRSCAGRSLFTLLLLQISPTAFSETINDINILLISAHDPAFGCLDNTLSVLTLYLSPLVLGSRYARVSCRSTERSDTCGGGGGP